MKKPLALDPKHYENAPDAARESVLRAALHGYHVPTLLGSRSHVTDQRDHRFRDVGEVPQTRSRIVERWAEASARARLDEVRRAATTHVLMMPKKGPATSDQQAPLKKETA